MMGAEAGWHLPWKSRWEGGSWGVGVGTGVSPLTHPADSNDVACSSFSRRSPWVEGGPHAPLLFGRR